MVAKYSLYVKRKQQAVKHFIAFVVLEHNEIEHPAMSLIVFEINNAHASFRLIGLSLGFSALHLNVYAVDERYIRHRLARIEADGTIDARSLIVRENIGRDAIDPSKAEIDRIDSVLLDFLSVFDAALISSFSVHSVPTHLFVTQAR